MITKTKALPSIGKFSFSFFLSKLHLIYIYTRIDGKIRGDDIGMWKCTANSEAQWKWHGGEYPREVFPGGLCGGNAGGTSAKQNPSESSFHGFHLSSSWRSLLWFDGTYLYPRTAGTHCPTPCVWTTRYWHHLSATHRLPLQWHDIRSGVSSNRHAPKHLYLWRQKRAGVFHSIEAQNSLLRIVF